MAQFAHGGGVALRGPDSKGAAVLYFKDQGSLRSFDSEGQVTNQVLAVREGLPIPKEWSTHFVWFLAASLLPRSLTTVADSSPCPCR